MDFTLKDWNTRWHDHILHVYLVYKNLFIDFGLVLAGPLILHFVGWALVGFWPLFVPHFQLWTQAKPAHFHPYINAWDLAQYKWALYGLIILIVYQMHGRIRLVLDGYKV